MRRLTAWLDRAVEREASTRSAALLRIGLAVIIFARFSDALFIRRDLDWPGAAILIAFWIGTPAMLVGYRSRLATGLSAASMIAGVAYLGETLHRHAWASHHHVYLLIAATCGVALTPSGRSYSVDRWLAIRRSEARGEAWPAERGHVGALYLIALQLSAVYFWGAFNKSTLGWLSGDKLESQLLQYILDSDPPALPGWRAFLISCAIATTVLEYSLAFGLWIPAARRVLIPAGILFHVSIYITLPVTIFSALSCLLYLAYFDPDEVHITIDRLSGTAPPRTPGDREDPADFAKASDHDPRRSLASREATQLAPQSRG